MTIGTVRRTTEEFRLHPRDILHENFRRQIDMLVSRFQTAGQAGSEWAKIDSVNCLLELA